MTITQDTEEPDEVKSLTSGSGGEAGRRLPDLSQRQRFYALKSGKRTERVSWIAALKEGNLFAPMTFAGAGNRDLFEIWLEQCLLPQLQPGDVIVIDNASFHHRPAIEEIVAAVGCEIWYLPPYSPNLNKIEHWWFVLKNWMRQRWSEFESVRDCVDAAFKVRPNVLA